MLTREPTQDEINAWHAKHGIAADVSGVFEGTPEGKLPLPQDKLAENIRVNAARHDVPNMRHVLYNKRTMVFVAGGPSAGDFLDDIRAKASDERYDVFCSNKTAQWLLDNGIVPRYQVVIDPKIEKVHDVAHRHPDITYLLSLQCDPAVFDTLAELKVEKFLAAGSQEDHEAAREAGADNLVSIGGGTMMGTRAMTLAHVLGYRRLEYYGFDGSVRMTDSGVQHYSYDKPRPDAITEVICEDGRRFDSTLVFQRQVQELLTFRERMPWLDIVIYGDGLLAHELALAKAKESTQSVQGVMTLAYKRQQQELHAAGNYGVSGHRHAPRIYLAAAQILAPGGTCWVLDYGAGQGTLKDAIYKKFALLPGLRWAEYDPCIESKSREPDPADIVACTDVMEHVEEPYVEAVLRHIASLTRKLAYFAIDLVPASKMLPDGRNAHVTLKPAEWWEAQVRKHFIVVESSVQGAEVVIVGQAIPQ